MDDGLGPAARAALGGMPTQKDVARLAGVSPVTVSRTLRGGKNVRPDIQQRVFDAVEQLEYLPNHNARSLRPGQQSGLIGVTVTSLSNPYFGTFALGVEQVAAERGRYVLLGSTSESALRESDLVLNFISRQVEGLIVIPASEPSDRHWTTRLGKVPLVVASREIEQTGFDVVLVDDLETTERATRALLAEGHSRVAFLSNAELVSTHRNRYQGFLTAMHDGRCMVDPQLVLTSGHDEVEDARRFTASIFSKGMAPTAILCANNRLAVGALRAFSDELRRGTDSADLPLLVCFDRLELAELLPMRVRVIAHDPQELGRAAAELLFARLEAPSRPPQRVVLETASAGALPTLA